ncbi:MAG: hypothetical protein NTZ26_14970 [Candidatus Aminicenantes bacterium]|nr:hypothetical protein [Candidatus Aminicenantes bacterium]
MKKVIFLQIKADQDAAKRRGRPRQTFFDQTPQALSRDPNISSGAKALFALLHGYCPQKRLQNRPEVVITKERLAKDSGKSVRRIDIRVNELKEKGWIDVQRQGRKQPNKYVLNAAPMKLLVAWKGKCPRPAIYDIFGKEYDPYSRERYRRELAAIYGNNGSKLSEKEMIAFFGPPPDIEDIPCADLGESGAVRKDYPVFPESDDAFLAHTDLP